MDTDRHQPTEEEATAINAITIAITDAITMTPIFEAFSSLRRNSDLPHCKWPQSRVTLSKIPRNSLGNALTAAGLPHSEQNSGSRMLVELHVGRMLFFAVLSPVEFFA